MEEILDKLNASFFSETLLGIFLLALITSSMHFLFNKALEILKEKGEKLYLRIIKCILIIIIVGSLFIYAILIFRRYEYKKLSEKITVSDMRGQNKKEAITYLKKRGLM